MYVYYRGDGVYIIFKLFRVDLRGFRILLRVLPEKQKSPKPLIV